MKDLWSDDRYDLTVTASQIDDEMCVVTVSSGMDGGWRIVSAWYQESDRAIESAVLLANAGEDAVRRAYAKGIVIRGESSDVEDWRLAP